MSGRKEAEGLATIIPDMLHVFIQLLQRTWFREDGADDEGDEDGLELLEHIPQPADPIMAGRVAKLVSDFRTFVNNDHEHPDHPEWSGQYFVDEAYAIVAYDKKHPVWSYLFIWWSKPIVPAV